MNTKTFSSCILLLGIFLLAPLSLQADVIPYGDFAGTNVNFLGVTETSGEVGQLYGTPTVDGNSLNFLFPPGFISKSKDGDEDFIDGGLSFVVQSQNPDFMFNSISVDEFGAFFDLGDASLSEVVAIAFVEVDGQLYNGQFDFTNIGGGNGPDGSNGGPWIEGVTIYFPSTNEATFFLNNILATSADDNGGIAFIDKKNIRITVGAIPEPTSGLLVLCGMGLMAFRRRR